MIGKTISHYKIVDKLGEGGMGAVYKAEDTTLNRLVALKTLSGHLTEDEEAKERFVREAQSASSLNHPNITTIYEFLEEDDTRVICMEYIEGKTIRDMVESGVVSVRKAIDIIIQAAEALEAAHSKGILHRDVKSANIMVSLEGRVKVMDFGLAHLEERSQLTRTGTTMGTLSYSSPEQISGRSVDRRSEVFSLGVVFYELLTGQLPFKANNEAEIIFAIINNEPPKVSKLRDDVPELVEAVVSKMLEKDSEQRYQSCADVIHDLQGIRKEMETSTVGITGVLDRVQVSRKKMMFQRVAVGVLVVALIVAGAILLTRGGSRLNPDQVVVAVFNNRTGNENLDLEGERAANWITQELQRSGIQVIGWLTALQSYQYVLSEIEKGTITDPISALAKETGAGIVISGTIYPEEGELCFQAEIFDVHRGIGLSPLDPIVGNHDQIGDLIRDLGSRIPGYFAIDADTRVVGLGNPPSIEAYEAFSQGLGKYIQSVTGGIEDFYRAYRLDSTFVKPLRYAALALWNGGRSAELDSVMGVMNRHLNDLSEYERCWFDYLQAIISGDYEASFQAMQKATTIAPGSKASMNYAVAAWRTNRPSLTVKILKSLDPSSGAIRGWAPYWAHLSRAHHMLGNHRKALKAARQGLQVNPEYASLQLFEVFSLAALNKINDVDDLLQTEFLPPDGAQTWRNTALELREHGHHEASSEVLNRLIEWYGDQPEEERQTHRNGLALTLYYAERWDEAYSIYSELIEEEPLSLQGNYHLGLLAARRNDRDEAIRYMNKLREIHGMNNNGRGGLQYDLACIYSLLGDKEEAVRLLSEAFSMGMMFGPSIHRDLDLEPLHGYPAYEAFIRPKD